jgi:hypothetical protein
MSKLNQLASENPTKFKNVASSIASQLAARASSQKVEYARRGALQAELVQVEREEAEAQGTAPSTPSAQPVPSSPSDGTSGAEAALISTFQSAASSGSFGTSGGAAAVNWSESGLASGLAEALSLVDQALGLAT